MRFSSLLFAGALTFSLHAQDFYRTTVSAQASGMGGVYIASPDHALDALAANPAGLTVLTAPTASLGLTGIFAQGSFSNSVNRNSPLRDAPGVAPDAAFGTPVGHSRFSVGVGVLPELLSVSNWNYVDAPGAAGASYGLQQQKSAIVAVRAAAAGAWAVNDRLSLGVSLGAVYNQNTLDSPYIFQSNPVLAGLKTLLDLHTAGVGWSAGAGVLARPFRRVSVNGAWKSHTMIESSGRASGNLSQQFVALGLSAPPAFQYSARVRNVLPRSVLAGLAWNPSARWLFAAQADRVDWGSAFQSLPVFLTQGTNGAVNSLLHSTSLNDRIPLLWKNQYTFRGGVERRLAESVTVRGGFAHANNPVPASTLSPLTAAIMVNRLSAGLTYRTGRWRFDFAYAASPPAKETVRQSALLSGEYNNSMVRIATQTLMLDSSFRF